MDEKANTPSIRFAGFTDAWEQRKLGKIAIFNPKEELPDEFEYVDLESVVGTEMFSHRTENKATAPSRAQRLAHTGDLFYQTVRPYQKNNYLFERPDKHYVFSTGYVQIRPFVDGYLLLSLVQSHRFVKIVLDNCTGTSYPAINANDLAEIVVYTPVDKHEHRQIGTFFRSIDSLITLHQRKYDKLVNIKKSMMEKMFPQHGTDVPEIRFAGFTNSWELRKFGDDIISIQTGTNKLGFNKNKGTPLLKMGNIQRGYFTIDKLEYLSESDKVEEENIVYYGDFFFNTRNTLELVGKGATWIGTSGAYAFNSNIARFKLRNINTIFFNYLYNTQHVISQVHARAMGTTSVAAIYPQSLNSIEYYIPCQEEQKIMGDFFLGIDMSISLHQRKLTKLKNIKKSCLEKMFV